MIDRVWMTFVVLLHRLTPAERAAFLLHVAGDASYREVATRLGRNEPACRLLLSEARRSMAIEKRVFQTSRGEHRGLLVAFAGAVKSGERQQLLELLAEDAVLLTDAAPSDGHLGRLRTIGRPVIGRAGIVAVARAFARERLFAQAVFEERVLNGEPALVAFRDGRAVAAVLVAVADGRIRHLFVQIDPERLQHVAPLN